MAHSDNDRITWEEYSEQTYLFIDYSGLTDLEVFNVSIQSRKILKDVPLNSVSLLVDMRNMDISFSTLSTFTKFADENRKYLAKVALIENIEENDFFQQQYDPEGRLKEITFSTKEEALAFLCGDK